MAAPEIGTVSGAAIFMCFYYLAYYLLRLEIDKEIVLTLFEHYFKEFSNNIQIKIALSENLVYKCINT